MRNKVYYEEVSPEMLRWRCNPDSFNFNTTNEISACETIIGQERALKALRLGLDIESPGYNIFVTGQAGTGRSTAIRCLLAEIVKKGKAPEDKCYVNNFKDPDRPRLISLPPGKGKAFKKDMEGLIIYLKRNIPQVLESEDYQKRRKIVVEKYKDQEKELIKDFEKRVNREGFVLVQVPLGPYVKLDIFPIVEGNAVPLDQMETLVEAGKFPPDTFQKLKRRYGELSSEMEDIFQKTRQLDKKIGGELTALEKEVVLPVVKGPLTEIKEKYKNERIDAYLDEVQENVLENLSRFQEKGGETPLLPGLPLPRQVDTFLEYQVNVLVDNSEIKGAPIVFENSPTYQNLFGMVEKVMDRAGLWRTDFTKIKAGSFLRAHGGYLIINARDALLEPGVWPALKRTLKNRRVEIQSYDPFYLFTPSALKPEPIDVNVKVVMVGDEYLYRLLYNYDDDFKKIFKVKGDFDIVMEKNQAAIYHYASFIRKICQEEKLLPFDKRGVAAVVEYGVRIAGKQKKLSTEFNRIADLIREASYWAKKEGSSLVTEKHVDKAIEEGIERVRLIEEKIKEMIKDGTIMVDTEGVVIGQVNGLAVYDIGDYAFGKPSRITAKTSMGRAGIINIEREADLSGKTHNKGVLIIGGYLRGKYAQEKPLTLSASICFEQSYSEVDGDSASSTEIYAILSSLSGLTLRQDIAITGSVNQKGEIQPIGGVNQKIEGFFDVCKAKGLTGTQGVIIPYLNIPDLMLRKDLVEAVKEGKFHIYPVKTIDEGIEILTGIKAGERRADGTYEEGTVNYLVDRRLRELALGMKEFETGEKEKRGD